MIEDCRLRKRGPIMLSESQVLGSAVGGRSCKATRPPISGFLVRGRMEDEEVYHFETTVG